MKCTIEKLAHARTEFCTFSYQNDRNILICANSLTALGLAMPIWQFVVGSVNVLIFQKGYGCLLHCSIVDFEDNILRAHRGHAEVSTGFHLFRHYLEYK